VSYDTIHLMKIVRFATLAAVLFFGTVNEANAKPKKASETEKAPSKQETPPASSAAATGIEQYFPRFELRTAPIAFIARWLTLEALYRLNDKWAVGPSFVYYGSGPTGSMFWLSYQGRALGLVATHYLRGVSQRGWYGSLRYHYEDYTYYPHAKSEEQYYKGHSLIAVAGYRFLFLKSFFVMPGLGAKLSLYEHTETKFGVANVATRTRTPSRFQALPYIEAKLGVEF